MNAARAGIEVRRLRASDEAEWRRLWTAYLAFYRTELPEPAMASAWCRLMGDDPRDAQGHVAVLDGRPVGLSHHLLQRHGWRVEEVCYLQDLYADPDVRGMGVGRALIEAVYAAADAAGAPYVYWTTAQDNAVARRLYDRIGRLTPFVKYERA